MSMPPRQMLRNASRRPVELHLADRVEILLPEAMVELAPEELATACVAPLLASGALTQLERPPAKVRKARAPTTKSNPRQSAQRPARPAVSKAARPARVPAKSSTPSPEGHPKPSGDPQ